MEGKLGWILHSKWPFPLPTGFGAQTIHQWPSTKVKLKGSPLSLECTVKGTSSPNLYWYRQAEGGGPQLLFYSIAAGQVDSQAPENFEASRPEDGYFILHSKKLLLIDSGFYLCAWSITLSCAGQTSVQKPRPPLSPHHTPQEPSLGDWVEGICHWVSHGQPMWEQLNQGRFPKRTLLSSQGEQNDLHVQNLWILSTQSSSQCGDV